jgi:hypothetical protein
VILFYAYAPVQSLIFGHLSNGLIEWIDTGLTAAFIFYYCAALMSIPRYFIRLGKITRLLNIVSLITIFTCLINLWVFLPQILLPKKSPTHQLTPNPEITASIAPDLTNKSALPDIYWIVLDTYAREDVLEEIYNVDNRQFLEYLDQSGFYVAHQASSNYNQTLLSISSTMNLDYLDHLAALDPSSKDRELLTYMINHSSLVSMLKRYGYETVYDSCLYPPLDYSSADIVLTRTWSMNVFEWSSLSNLVGEGVLKDIFRNDYRSKTIWQVKQVVNLAEHSGNQPRFIYIHILIPHPPFLFSNGQRDFQSLNIDDGSSFRGTRAEYIEGYREQLAYANEFAQKMVTAILAQKQRKAIIVLQGDHGPGSHLDWTSYENSCPRERLSILDAYYFPDQDYSKLSQDITPVNTFRVILDQYFGANLKTLPNHSYFSTWDKPYDSIDAKARLTELCK